MSRIELQVTQIREEISKAKQSGSVTRERLAELRQQLLSLMATFYGSETTTATGRVRSH